MKGLYKNEEGGTQPRKDYRWMVGVILWLLLVLPLVIAIILMDELSFMDGLLVGWLGGVILLICIAAGYLWQEFKKEYPFTGQKTSIQESIRNFLNFVSKL